MSLSLPQAQWLVRFMRNLPGVRVQATRVSEVPDDGTLEEQASVEVVPSFPGAPASDHVWVWDDES